MDYTKVKSLREFMRMVEEQPINTKLYVDDYVEGVAVDLYNSFSNWQEVLELSDERFWSFFKRYEA